MLTAEVFALTTRVETHVAARTPPVLPAARAPWFIRAPSDLAPLAIGDNSHERRPDDVGGPSPVPGGRRPGRSLENLVGPGDGEGIASPGHTQFCVQAGDVGLDGVGGDEQGGSDVGVRRA